MTKARLTGLLLAGALVFAAPAAGSTRIVAPPHPIFPYQRWIDRAKVPTPAVRLRVIEAPCPTYPNASGCRRDDDRAIFLRPDRIILRSQRNWLFMHEVGHIFDNKVLTDRERGRFKVIFRDTRPWAKPVVRNAHGVRPGPFTPGSPMERFAQAYAECAIKGPRIAHRPKRPRKYRYRPTPKQHAATCQLIERAF